MLYPVIMCGGAGTRLWPASRPSRPKQFIPLAGNRSLFQDTVLRVAGLAEGGGALIVVGGVAHRGWIVDQLEEIGVQAQVLLEPEPRDSAAAMAAAAVWTTRRDPAGINAFVASDHHIPDDQAFRAAVSTAAQEAAQDRIVTLGVKPTGPSSAYGYIRPDGPGLAPVEAFVEKPDAETAARHVAAGYLWNSGNFITGAVTLLEELRTHAPAVEAAARAALPDDTRSIITLTSAFSAAPKISIDYAVMENTRRASVLPVDFAWSDLGAWDAIRASGEGDFGMHILEDADGCLVRAPEGVIVAALGVRNLAIVAENDAILVCDIDRAQEVKRVVERVRTTAPQHLDFVAPLPENLEDGALRLAEWMRLRALPLWSTLGQSAGGAFAEAMTLDGRAFASVRHLRVQARQVQTFAEAGRLGWSGPWRRCVNLGLSRLFTDYQRPDGWFRARLAADGSPLDDEVLMRDQAMVLTALATARAAGADHDDLDDRAAALREALSARALPNGAIEEAGCHPWQAGVHMRLLEAALAWETVSDDPAWTRMADQITGFARSVLIGADGFVPERFTASWTPTDDGPVEPGRQFEWAWLLARVAGRRMNDEIRAQALRLHDLGRAGVMEGRQMVVEALDRAGAVRSSRPRLRPQTERLKAALALSETAADGARAALLTDAASAQRAVWAFLTADGLWRDKMTADGGFIDEPAPGGSLHHLMALLVQFAATAKTGGLRGGGGSPLS